MTIDQFSQFLKAVTGDMALRDRLSSVKDFNEIVLIAADLGFTITLDDLQDLKSQVGDEELEQLTAGTFGSVACIIPTYYCPPPETTVFRHC